MAKNYELEVLRRNEQYAFKEKQMLWEKYVEARDRTSAIFDEMTMAWDNFQNAKETLDHEHDLLQAAEDEQAKIWDAFYALRDELSRKINILQQEATDAHNSMVAYFKRSHLEVASSNKDSASANANRGTKLRNKRDHLNAEVAKLIAEIRTAREKAMSESDKVDKQNFNIALATYYAAKNRHNELHDEFIKSKEARDEIYAAFQVAHAEHTRLRNEYKAKQAAIRAA